MDTSVGDLTDYRNRVREWLAQNLAARTVAQTGSETGVNLRSPEGLAQQRALQRRLYEAGLTGITWPTEYGGQGLSPAHEQVFREEADTRVLPNFDAAGRTTSICAQAMLRHAPQVFLRRHIPSILAGDELWVQLLSEPAAGSDLAGVLTRAEWIGQSWSIHGSKVWTSGADYADYGMCLARTDWDAPKHQGLTWFAVKLDSPGVTVRPLRQINGGSDFCEVFLEGVELSAHDIIGEVNQGWTVARTLLQFERAEQRRPPTKTEGRLDFAPEVVTLARRLSRDKQVNVRQLIARAHTYAFVVSELSRRIEQVVALSTGNDAVVAYRKLAVGMFDPLRAEIGMEVGRESAVAWDPEDSIGSQVARTYLDGRITSIAGGSNEMMRNVIGERILGLPREPDMDHGIPFREVLKRAQNWRDDPQPS